MAFEGIVLKRAADHALSRLSGGLISHQSPFNSSGPPLYPQPTVLEPYFVPVDDINNVRSVIGKPADIIYESPDKQRQLCRYTVLPSTSYEYRWDKPDFLLRHLPALYDRCGFEIVGNSKKVKFRFLCDKNDFPVLSTAFSAKFLDCALREDCPEFFDRHYEVLKFRDYNAPGLYSHLLTQPAAFKSSAYETLLFVLTTLPKETMGFAQVLFKACSPANNWHRNVEILTDIEYLHGQMQIPGRFPQQPPSKSLVVTSTEIDTKSHRDKPFFGAAVRVGICGEDDSYCRRKLECMCSCRNLFRHSGRALEYISDEQYGDIDTRQMFEQGLVYRPGMLVNSTELAGWVHVPPIELFSQTSCKLETLSPQFRNPMGVVTMDINKGTLIGYRQADHGREAFVLPAEIRHLHCHIMGRPGKGKSTVEENMILGDISRGDGVTVIDAHDDMIDNLLDRIPENAVNRTIVFDLSNDGRVPLYNPLDISDTMDKGEAAGTIVSVLKSVFPEGWGLRMEHILKCLIQSLLCIKGTSFMELSQVLRKDSDKGKQILNRLISAVEDEEILHFLRNDFTDYRREELTPVIHRISPLVCSGIMSLSLLQPENRFDFCRIMDEGMILLVKLGSLGRDQTISMGGFMLSSMYSAIRQRIKYEIGQRKPHHIYVDEAHLFQIDALEKLLVEGRKCQVSFNLAHQYLSQFKKERADSLMTTGTSIVFGVGASDAAVMKKNFQNKVDDREFMELGVGEAMIKVENDIARVTTLNRPDVTKSYREQIIRNSHQRYYKPAQQIRRNNRFRFKGYHEPFATVLPEELICHDGALETEVYDSYE